MDILTACRTYLESELAKTSREIRELTPYGELFAAELGELHARHDFLLDSIASVATRETRSRILRGKA